MPVSNTTVRLTFEDIVAATPISVGIKAFSASTIVVRYGNAKVLAVINTDYTITLNSLDDYNDFTLTPLAALITKINNLIAADPLEQNIIEVSRDQGDITDFDETQSFFRRNVEREFERTWMRTREIDERVDNLESLGDFVEAAEAAAIAAAASAADAEDSKDATAISAAAADASADAAALSAAAAQTAETNAELAEANAELAEANAELAEANAELAAADAAASALAADASADAADVSEAAAAASAVAADASADAAALSEADAEAAALAADASADAAAASAVEAEFWAGQANPTIAVNVSFTPDGNIAADNVQAAIVEVRDDAAAALATHAALTNNPHSVTKSQVGLGNVDNTSDANKPVSTAQQTALDAKAPLTDPLWVGSPRDDIFVIIDTAGFVINPRNGGLQVITLGASRTPVFTGWQAGDLIRMRIADGTAFTITWSGGPVVWKGGSAPTLATSGYTEVCIDYDGTTYRGVNVGDFAS